MDDIERMLIERECERLINQYCLFVDFGEASRIADLFTEDGWWENESIRMVGQDGIRREFGKRQDVSRRTSRHLCTNVLIDVIDRDHATGVCYLINYRHDSQTGVAEMPAPADTPKFVGEYRDTFVRTAGGWRFATRRCDITFIRQHSHKP
jgi:hypothetical protein